MRRVRMSNELQPVTDQDIMNRFNPLFSVMDHAQTSSDYRPLMAHYTSIKVMESIFQSNEVWFSNPLFMNDLQELRYGMHEGTRFFSNIEQLKSAGGSDT